MPLIYLDALGHDNKPVQFSFRADQLDLLFKAEKIIKAFDKRYGSEYIAGETTYAKSKVKEIKATLISKDGTFRFT